MNILEGKKISKKILETVKKETRRKKIKPGLAVILIGKNKASEIYVRIKKEKAKEVGIYFSLFRFKKSDSEIKILKKIEELNKNQKISGIIVQLPLPEKFNTEKIIRSISPLKDVDGFHEENIKLFLKNKERFFPVFPQAIMILVEGAKKNIENKKAIIISNSKIFGKMMSKTLSQKKCKASYVLKSTIGKNLKKIKEADVIVVAVGVPKVINGRMVKAGSIVIDGGITKKGKKVLGDADFESFKNISGWISPVPGGVGPLTIACLLRNVLLAKEMEKI